MQTLQPSEIDEGGTKMTDEQIDGAYAAASAVLAQAALRATGLKEVELDSDSGVQNRPPETPGTGHVSTEHATALSFEK